MLRSRRPLSPLFAFVLAAALMASPLPAADWPVPRGPSHEPQPVRYDPKQWQRVPREFIEDAAACILYSGSTYLIEPDGTSEVITHEITRLNGRKAIEKLGEYRGISYDPSYQKLTLNEARIHKADGRVASIDPRHLQLRDVSTDYQVYDHNKQLIISFPGLEVGDTIEVKWTLRGKNSEHTGQFFTRYSFGDLTYPDAVDELRVRLPKDRPFKYQAVNERIEPTKSVDGDNVLYVWRATNRNRPPQDDNLPPREELRPAVCCSTFASWREVAQWKQRLRAECWKCTEDVRKIVQEVTRGLSDPTAKARALTYWLRRNIRYVSVGEKHDYTPHLPSLVLSNRFGDCKDTSQLLAVMLREAGLKVELATLGLGEDGQILEEVPSPWGTHAILLVTIAGKEHWIDTTASLAGWDFLPHDDHDRSCYLVDDQGHVRLKRTPPLTPEGNRFEQTTTIRIGADGSSRNERSVVAFGSAAMGQRDLFLEVPVGERRRQMTSELQDANNTTRLLRLNVDEARLRDFDQPTRAEMVFEVPRQFSGTPDKEGNFSDSRVWGRLLSHNIDYDREVSVQLYAPFESRHRFVVHVHPVFALETIPRDKKVRSAWGSHTRAVKLKGNLLEVTVHTRLEKTRVEPADFDRFRQFQDEISKSYRVWLTLKPATDLAAAPLLETLCRLAPDDTACAIALAKLYQKNFKMAEACRVLRQARHYHPNDVALLELSVKSATKLPDEEQLQRELVRCFPDEPRYQLDLADILIRSRKQPEARKLLRPLLEKGPAEQRAKALFYLARSQYRTGKDELEDALSSLEAARNVDPDTVDTVFGHQLEGQILMEIGRPADAVRAFEHALTINPEAEFALDSLVRLMMADNKPDRALHYLRRYVLVVSNDVDDVSGLLLAAESYLKLKRYDDALELALKARDQKFHEKAYRIIGLVWLHRGDLTQAFEYLEKANLDSAVLEGRLQALLGLGRLDEAADRLDLLPRIEDATPGLHETVERTRRLIERRKQLLTELPAPDVQVGLWKKALGYAVCAEELYREGKPARQVEALLTLARSKDGEPGIALGLRARQWLDQGKLSRALAEADRAIQASPKQANGYYVRGRVLLERGQKEALDVLRKAVELSGSSDADVLQGLAEALAQAGKYAEAVVVQRQAVKLRPGDKELQDRLDTLEKRKQPERPSSTP